MRAVAGLARLPDPAADLLVDAGLDPRERGATWTYLTTDNPFGKLSDRIRKGIVRKVQTRLG